MAAPRPDVKYYLGPLDHAALKEFADHDGLGLGELTESVMREYIAKRVHDVSVLAGRLQRAGVIRDEQGAAGEGRK